jgi:type I restriction enzyme M protein
VFKRQRVDRKVFFIDASHEYLPGSNQNYLRAEDLEKIFNTYQARQTIDKYAYLATFEELTNNDFNLNIPRYVDTFEPEPLVDMVAVNTEIIALRMELTHLEEKMVEYLKDLGL